MATDELTPMFRQYQELKRQYPDVILLFRCGDFYELYGEDAVIGAQAMDIALTARDMRGSKMPMAGVPFHAIDRYLSRLLAAGHKAAIADQMEDPRQAKGLVKRDVTRIITPGTIVEDFLLDERSNNYLLALHTEHGFGLAVADCSTGEFLVTETDAAHARDLILEEVSRLQPAEILVPADLREDAELLAALKARTNAPISTPDVSEYAWESAAETLTKHFGVSSLRGFGCEEMPLAVQAAGLLLRYLQQTQKTTVGQIRGMSTYSLSDHMLLDASTRRNLELTASLRDSGRTHSLLWLLDHTRTAMGARLLKKWLLMPLLDVDAITRRLDAVAAFRDDDLLREKIREELHGIHDLERLLSRAASGTGNARDLAQLRDSLGVMPRLLASLEDASPVLKALVEGADTLDDLRQELATALVDAPPISVREGGMIRPGYHEELDTLRRASTEGKDWIAALEATERERTGIKSLKVGFNNVFGYYIELSRANLDLVPSDYIRKQTLANAERYITPALKEYEAMVLGAEDKLKELEFKLFSGLRGAVAMEADRVQRLARLIAQVDVLADFAEVAARNRYQRPVVTVDDTLSIHNGRHPVVEQTQAGERFVPNDAHLDTSADQLILLTGPNMAGKCLHGDTLLFTDRGILPLRALMPDTAPEGAFTPLDCRIQGAAGAGTVTHFYRGARQATVKITTRLGFHLEGTPEHRVWMRHPDGSEGWQRLGNLAVGDYLAIARDNGLWGNQLALDTAVPKPSGSGKQYPLPAQMDIDLAYLLGLLVGDGTTTYRNAVLLSTGDTFIAEEFARIAKRLFAYRVRQKTNGKDYSITSTQIRVFLERLGLGYCPAQEKYIPQSILRAPREIAVAFLQGLFDTDGFIDNRYGNVFISTASERLAREVQALLLNCGIIGSLRKKTTKARPAYIVSIFGEDAIHFNEVIGFRLPGKQVRRTLASSLRMPNVGGIPYLAPVLKEIQARIVATTDKPVALKKNKRINSIFYAYLPSNRNISHHKLDELVTYCDENGVACPELKALQAQHRLYLPVETIEAGEAEVFDLSVTPDHAYIASGFVSHNSTYLRQVALITLLAQIGSFVPAEAAEIGVVDRIFTRVGASDDLATGQSTFMVEMTEAANILNNATRKSLVILDEIGRGTSTFDGLSIAWAVAEYLHESPRLGCKTLFATHYHQLNELGTTLARAKNYRIAVKEGPDGIVFLRKIVPGGTDRSYGIHVAKLAGLPQEVVDRAQQVLHSLEENDEIAERARGLVGTGATIPPPLPRTQLTLFEVVEHPVVDELMAVDVDDLTPRQALDMLARLQKKAKQP